MSFYIIMGLWSLSMIVLITSVLWWGNRVETARRKARESVANERPRGTCPMCCQSCGRYPIHPDHSVR
jgi:hypothetical protein